MLCRLCQLISIHTLRAFESRHQPSLAALRSSAEAGCDFCKLLWTALLTAPHQTDLKLSIDALSTDTSGIDTTIRLWCFNDLDNTINDPGLISDENDVTVVTGKTDSPIWNSAELRLYALAGKKLLDLIHVSHTVS